MMRQYTPVGVQPSYSPVRFFFLGPDSVLSVFLSFSFCFATLSDRWIFAIVRAANHIHRERAGDRKCTVGSGVAARSTCEKYRQEEQEL